MRFGMVGAALVSAALSASLLVGCGGPASSAPQDVTFDTSTGSFTFKAVDGGDTYTVGVSKILNDTTGKALESINGSGEVTVGDKTDYVWSEQTGSVSGLSDSDGDGTVDGTVVFREFSSSATKVGDVISMDKLPVGHYILSVVPSSTSKLTNPETAYYEFTMPGTLAEPDGFTAKVNDDGVIEITASSDYYLSCLTETGLPEKMVFEVKDESGSVVDTIEMDDFSYTNTVNGPNKMFTFNNQTVTGTAKLDASKAYTVTVTAEGDGDQIKSASAEAMMATSTPAAEFATTYDTTGSATAGTLSVAVTLGTDATGANLYELTASANDMVIYRESGTYEASEAAGTHDEKNTFPEGATITFSTSASDFSTPVLDGVSATVKAEEARGGWGAPGGASAGKNYSLTGTIMVDGESCELGAASGGFPGGPM